MYGWCSKCQAITIDGLCSKHGPCQPISHITGVDIHPLAPFEKELFNTYLHNLKLGDGIFLMFPDRMFRRKIVTLDRPLAEVKLTNGNLRVTAFADGKFEGMDENLFIQANANRINRLTEVATAFSEWELRRNPNAIISFSGGKDSMVLADLLASFNLKNVFIDTRLEFPETYAFIKNLKRSGWDLDITRALNSFFPLCQQKGFPDHGNRWCCKTQKFEPFARYIQENFDKTEVLVFSGERRAEGLYRISQPFKKKHKYILQQQTLQPLLDWSALDIWAYIWAKQLPVNPIYEYFDRAGCWLCPFGLEYRIFLLQFTHPKLYKALGKIGGRKASKTIKAINHNTCLEEHQPNWGKIRNADGVAKVGGLCGDTMEVCIKVEDSKIMKARFTTDGCYGAITCGEAATELAKGKNILEALKITPDDILAKASQIPESESHCSILAANALREAIKNYSSKSRTPGTRGTRNCTTYGHLFVDGVCIRCGLPDSSTIQVDPALAPLR